MWTIYFPSLDEKKNKKDLPRARDLIPVYLFSLLIIPQSRFKLPLSLTSLVPASVITLTPILTYTLIVSRPLLLRDTEKMLSDCTVTKHLIYIQPVCPRLLFRPCGDLRLRPIMGYTLWVLRTTLGVSFAVGLMIYITLKSRSFNVPVMLISTSLLQSVVIDAAV